MTDIFASADGADITRLVEAYPLCWVVSGGTEARHATPLPLLPETGDDGRLQSLLGHIARRNPQQSALEADPRASILCMGPQAYISPALVSNPTWGPTWNYAVCRFEVDIEFVPGETGTALARLAEALEGGSADSWTPARMGPRYDALKQHIVGFRAHVRETHARFKLGQDETDATFAEIVDGLAGSDLAEWMQRTRA
ncbi:FMN-binding negative transcriptional regulator [Sphingomonas sp.]|uniref:FMN-binding negative transcriptional regulator n=1 Tax=Sphingomonas sp. TaxID=28214 RepID=UPI0025EE6CE0|nr:FMN-binding negative transcriptional regulator [Sphingomonas sp.]MBV9526818.1 FMN-binding negative transcriptional regulator [Sphingomonas sp.]